ncbi:hypothetical protein HDU98_005983 [Podochytrium sp. JEL0797]|nr:hypothetical protein HDU98_005983 [Podochytrium sp. JEL0797]
MSTPQVQLLNSPPLSPVKRRKGTPTRSPKPNITNADHGSAVFIKFPFFSVTGSTLPSDSLSPPQELHNPTNGYPYLTAPTKPGPRKRSIDATANESNTTTTIASNTPTTLRRAALPSKASVRFEGDSFYGSSRFWWSRTVSRPASTITSPPGNAGSRSSSDSESSPMLGSVQSLNNDGDVKKGEGEAVVVGNGGGEATRSGEVVAKRGRGGRGGWGGARRGRGRGAWKKKALTVHALHAQSPLVNSATLSGENVPLLPDEWEALGPFAMGARELGVDPLSAYGTPFAHPTTPHSPPTLPHPGGFEAIPYSTTDKYPSELADEGFVQWFKVLTNKEEQTVGPVDFANVRWEFNQGPFGWTSLHHAIYFRGTLVVPKTGVYIVSFDNVVSYKINDKAYAGNVYGYAHASGTAMLLEKGEHSLYVCGVMDVRLFGGALPPKITFSGKFSPVAQDTPSRNIILFDNDAVVPETMDSRLITPFFSVTIMNTFIAVSEHMRMQHMADNPEPDVDMSAEMMVDAFGNPSSGRQELSAPGWVQILDIRAVSNDGTKLKASIPVLFSLKLAPGQIYPLPIDVTFDPEETTDPSAAITSVYFEIELYDLDRKDVFMVTSKAYEIRSRSWGEPYKITFLDYDNVVHYAMTLPPAKACSTIGEAKCPVILALHGAGVEAENPFWTEAFKRQDYAWILFPTGRTAWGFDWHGPSFLNVESALHAMTHLYGVPPLIAEKVGIDPNKLVYSGHSNGGQGAWWLSSHYPDRALAAMPASGYLKIQFYTPYYMRIGDAYTDPIFRAIMESSIAENDIDMYAANMAGIPILARTGGSDDNVPPINTRRIVRLVNEWNRDPNSVNLSEVHGQGHWFTGIMNDDVLGTFLDQHLDPAKNPGLSRPRLPKAFTISTLNPGSTGSKGGIKILQLEVPFRLAQIRVHREGNHWILNTINVRRFGFLQDERAQIDSWEIDGMVFNEPPKIGPSYLRMDGEKEWKLVPDLLWISEERYWSTYGPAAQILNHPFLIVIPSNPTTISHEVYHRNAQLIATSWYLYGRGGTQIIRDIDVRDGIAAKYHLIVLGGPKDNLFTRRREKEGGAEGNAKLVKFLESGGFQIESKKYEAPGTGMLFLAPSPTRTLMGMYITGIDELGFKRAVWTIPFRTGLMVPDYLVVGDEYGDPATGWTAGDGNPYGGAGTKGTGGIFAAGYWSNLLSIF